MTHFILIFEFLLVNMEWKPFLFQNLTFFFSPLFLETHWTSVASCFSIFTCCCSAFWGPATCTISSPPPPHPPPPSPPPPAPSPSSPGASHSPQLWVWSTSYLHLKGEVIRVHLQDHPTKTKATVSSSSEVLWVSFFSVIAFMKYDYTHC